MTLYTLSNDNDSTWIQDLSVYFTNYSPFLILEAVNKEILQYIFFT